MITVNFSIRFYGTVTMDQGVLIIGGLTLDNGISADVATVACYSNLKWERLDDLQSIRHGHRAIINGGKVYIIGGTLTQ